MPKCTIDGKEVEFTPGQNLIEVAKKAGIEIPYFCYHPGLTVVAQCRMCAVEIEKMPKLQTACSTPAGDGMVVKTRSPRALQNQKSVMEFLLVNHPLDCPICDKSGECDLQDFSYGYGDAYSRYTEEKRTYLNLDMGPVIQKNMNRCIHCTRCIRFGTEVAGIHEMIAVKRGNNTEITTLDGRPLETDYASNYADICPTGSLTLKDFRFRKRVWFLKKTPSVCEGCSRGCNLEIHTERGEIYRTPPRENLEINKYWLCDEGRFNYLYVNDEARIVTPRVGEAKESWKAGTEAAQKFIKGRNVAVLVGTDLTQEEVGAIKEFAGCLPKLGSTGVTVMHFGTPGVMTASEDAPADKILKRKSKTANLNGVERLGIAPFKALSPGVDAAIVFRGGRAKLPDLGSLSQLGVGVFFEDELRRFSAVLPGLTFAEKDGTVVNFEGREQKFQRAIPSVGQSKSMSEILMLWMNQKSGVAPQ